MVTALLLQALTMSILFLILCSKHFIHLNHSLCQYKVLVQWLPSYGRPLGGMVMRAGLSYLGQCRKHLVCQDRFKWGCGMRLE